DCSHQEPMLIRAENEIHELIRAPENTLAERFNFRQSAKLKNLLTAPPRKEPAAHSHGSNPVEGLDLFNLGTLHAGRKGEGACIGVMPGTLEEPDAVCTGAKIDKEQRVCRGQFGPARDREAGDEQQKDRAMNHGVILS